MWLGLPSGILGCPERRRRIFFLLPPPPPVPLHRITLDALMACRAFPFEKEGSITAAIADPGYTDAVVPRNPVAYLSLRADELGLLLSAVPLGDTGFVAGWSDATRGDPVLAVFDPLTGDLAGGLTGKDLFVRPAYRGHGIGPEILVMAFDLGLRHPDEMNDLNTLTVAGRANRVAAQRLAVIRALDAGLDVPDDVLEDHPDLCGGLRP